MCAPLLGFQPSPTPRILGKMRLFDGNDKRLFETDKVLGTGSEGGKKLNVPKR